MDDRSRVFFHELGHFVAHEINVRKYHGQGTRSFTVSPDPGNNARFVGEIKTNIPVGQDQAHPPDLKLLSETLAALAYGSIFQAYFVGDTLDDAIKKNGGWDYTLWRHFLWENKIPACGKLFKEIEDEYFEQLKTSRELDKILALDPFEFLEDKGQTHYTVNLEKLRQATDEFIDAHVSLYSQLVEQYERVITKSKLSGC